MDSHDFDTLIRRACVVDGTGGPSFIADIGISQSGAIASIGPALPRNKARRVVDADGLVAAPGFIDCHSHDDVYLFVEPSGAAKLNQGITTVVIGNCGFSMAPILPKTKEQALASLSIIGAARYPLASNCPFRFSEYLDSLAKVGPALNVAALVGHNTVRTAVVGIEDRPASSREIESMRHLVHAAMEAGAFGLSSGLVYVPGAFASTQELVALAGVAAAEGGLYTTHLRSEADQTLKAIDEALTIGKKAGVPVNVSHHKVMGKNNWGKSRQTLERFHRAGMEGLRVTCDVYPYTAGSTCLAAALPPGLQAEGPEIFSQKLTDPKIRAQTRRIIETETAGTWENLIHVDTFEGMVIAKAPNHPAYCGRSIAEIAEANRQDPFDLFFDLLAVEKMDAVIIEFMMHEDDVIRILRSPFSMVSTDGLPPVDSALFHPRFTNAFPRVLSRYVRELKSLSLEEAVWKMTGLPASTFGLSRKGLLKTGYDADLVLFDPARVCDCGTYEEPGRKPQGIIGVWVNGRRALEGECMSSERCGRVLRRGERPVSW